MLKLMSLVVLLVLSGMSAAPASAGKTKNVVLIVSDGLRWQEVFTGADPLLMNGEHGGSWLEDAPLKQRYWNDDVNQRRKMLFPFLWGTVAAQGQLIGNQTKGSIAQVTNGLAFSYPGYNEMSCGYPDPRINSNEFGPNPNVSVFEWLNNKSAFHGKVAIFGTWDAYHDIFNEPRSHLPMQSGWDLPRKSGDASKDTLLKTLFETTTHFDDGDLYNSFLQVTLLDYLKQNHPKVLFVGYGETDNWAHQGRYDLVLESAHRTDAFIQDLWDRMQSMPEYRGSTTFIITADHGRGSGLTEWKNHGTQEKGSENVWMAVIGPDTAMLGERSNLERVTQSQIAATIAALVGEDYPREVPKAAPPIKAVLAAH